MEYNTSFGRQNSGEKISKDTISICQQIVPPNVEPLSPQKLPSTVEIIFCSVRGYLLNHTDYLGLVQDLPVVLTNFWI